MSPYQIRLSQAAQDRITEIVDEWGGTNPHSLRAAIRANLAILATNPLRGRFDVYPRPIYLFNVRSEDGDGPFGIPIHAVYRILDDDEAILILNTDIVRF